MEKFSFIILLTLAKLIIFAKFSVCGTIPDSDVFINSDLKLKGLLMKSHGGKSFYSFRGIPYAKPPIGERRFKDPEPYGEWNEILDATKDSAICPQIENDLNELGDLKMSEDCLTINVYTPSMEGNKTVFAFIHGGGLRYGTAHSYHYAPEFILDEDVVLVTFNYRLGALGFVNSGTEKATSNYGLKDQVTALKWIQNNIHRFGGNPNSVTLIGHSAGSMSVTLHMVSPMSKNLFHRAVALSGSGTNQWTLYNEDLTKKLAVSVNCSIDSDEKMIECLREKPWEDFIAVGAKWDENQMPDMQWNVELEKDFGQERFMIEHPSVLFEKGEFYKVPIITGITIDEFAERGPKAVKRPNLLNEMDTNFNNVAPFLFGYHPPGTDKANHISDELRKLYFNGGKIDTSSEKGIGDIVSDALINYGVHRLVDLARKYEDVYYFRLDYAGHYSCATKDNNGKPLYVDHSDVLIYLFGYETCTDDFTDVEDDLQVTKKFTKYIVNLSNYGNPNGNTDEPICTTKWLPSTKDDMKMFHIDKTCSMGEPHNKKIFAVWDKLFPVSDKEL
ncbi:juvenile hormone esterase-like [Condylostylus longicornis]|uniref:juvenile hormone esterase-like n=1 Tax=Condylostylus longicornis TaxID=2530218 RepID=UPI00244DA1B9|nr:juvenile hormone esterase-like [Condylostylus longicornis]